MKPSLIVAVVCGIAFVVCAVLAFDAASGPIIGMIISGAIGFIAAWKAGAVKVKELDAARK
jgi:hypothetical protein